MDKDIIKTIGFTALESGILWQCLNLELMFEKKSFHTLHLGPNSEARDEAITIVKNKIEAINLLIAKID